MERSRLTYEVTNQQLMAVITKLSSQLARAKLPPPPPQQQLGSKPSTIVTPAAPSPAVSEATSSSSSSFRRQKGIRMKKRDSVRRSPGLVGDSQSCTSSDSGNYSDNTDTSLQAADGHNNNNNSNNSSHLQKLLRKGLHLVSSVNQELSRATPTAGEEKTRRPDNGCKDHLSSTISRSGGNTNKVIIKIQSGHCAPDTGPSPPRPTVSPLVGGGKSVNVGEIRTDAVSGCVRVPVPYRCTYYDV